jgi:ribosomal protein L22
MIYKKTASLIEARALGRADIIHKKTAHVTIVVAEKK